MSNPGAMRRDERGRAAFAAGLLALALGAAAPAFPPRAGQAPTADATPARPGLTAAAPHPAQPDSLADLAGQPASTERAAAERLGGGPAERGWPGVVLQPLDEELAGVLGAPDGKGALIASVEPDSPAARGGLEQGDIVIDVAGKAVQRQRDLAAAVTDAKPGSTVAVTVLRNGRRMERQVAVGEPPGSAGRTATTPEDAAGAVDAARDARRPGTAIRVERGGHRASPTEAG